MAALLDRCEQAYASLYLPEPAAGLASELAAELAVTGRWSPDLVSLRMSFGCGWVRHEPSPGPPASTPYWSARAGSLEVGSPVRGLLLAAAGRPGALEGMLARRREAAVGPVDRAREGDPRAGPFLSGAAVYALLPSLRSLPDGDAGARGLPLGELWLAARRQGEDWELGALASLAGAGGAEGAQPPSARALSGLVRLAAASWLRRAGIGEVTARIREMRIEVEPQGLEVRGLRLSQEELLAALRALLSPAGEAGLADRGD